MTTCRGNHTLETIYRDGPDMEENVVRWGQRCGAITVDVDVDGRTAPGDYMAMRLPATEEAKRGQS